MHFVVTGATGYVGKHVAARLLELGHTLSTVTRAEHNGASARARVSAALQPFARQLPPDWRNRLHVLEGDVTRPECDINAAAIEELERAEIDGFIHCAALTRFEQHLTHELFRTNLDGTRHAFDLHRRIGSPRFHHISTAFVAGSASRNAGPHAAFNNPYEASKYAAEKHLVLSHDADRAGVSIYRPAIVVGGFALGEGNSVSTVYTFIKAMDFLRECYRRDMARGRRRFANHGLDESDGRFHMPIRVAADPDTPLYLVPIETLVDAVIKRLRSPTPPIEIVQLCGHAFPLLKLRDAFCAAMNITGPMLVSPVVFEAAPRNAVEAHFHRMTRSYESYLLEAPEFHTETPRDSTAIDLRTLATDFLAQFRGDSGDTRKQVGAMAIDLHGITRARDYFDALIGNELARHFLKRHHFVDAAVRFRISGREIFDEIIVFRDGRANYAPPAATRDYDCSYSLEESLFLKCIAGRADLRNAFFTGKVSIEGNKEVALKFGSLLSQYYRDIESNVIEEVAVCD